MGKGCVAARPSGTIALVKILLVRHADAVELTGSLTDAERFLSAAGRTQARAIGRAIRSKEIEWDAVVCSPLVRAVQTAEIFAEAVGFAGVVEAVRSLSPGVPARAMADAMRGRGDAIAVVAHEPDLTALGALFAGRPSFPSFRKGEAMLLDGGAPAWRLDPKTLEFDRLIVA